MPFNGRKTDERYLHLLLRPFALFFHPGILWACLIQGTLIGWTVMIGVVLAGISKSFTSSQYWVIKVSPLYPPYHPAMIIHFLTPRVFNDEKLSTTTLIFQ